MHINTSRHLAAVYSGVYEIHSSQMCQFTLIQAPLAHEANSSFPIEPPV